VSEMVERVARALCERCGVLPDDMAGGTWDGGSYAAGEPAWTTWKDDARAAIEAMRDPTEAMVTAGDSCVSRLVWRDMINEALK